MGTVVLDAIRGGCLGLGDLLDREGGAISSGRRLRRDVDVEERRSHVG